MAPLEKEHYGYSGVGRVVWDAAIAHSRNAWGFLAMGHTV